MTPAPRMFGAIAPVDSAVLRGGGEDARAGERGDHGVIDQQDVRRVSLLAGEQRCVVSAVVS